MRSVSRAGVTRALAIALLLTTAASCGSTPGATHDLSGYVTDADSHAPIPGAMVTFRSDTLRTFDTTSDGSGLYRMLIDTDVPFGQVKASKDGFDEIEATVEFDTDSRRVDLPMRNNGSAMMPTP